MCCGRDARAPAVHGRPRPTELTHYPESRRFDVAFVRRDAERFNAHSYYLLFTHDEFVIPAHPVRQQKGRAVIFAMPAAATINDEWIRVPLHHRPLVRRQ